MAADLHDSCVFCFVSLDSFLARTDEESVLEGIFFFFLGTFIG